MGISRSFWNEALPHPAFSSLGLQGRDSSASRLQPCPVWTSFLRLTQGRAAWPATPSTRSRGTGKGLEGAGGHAHPRSSPLPALVPPIVCPTRLPPSAQTSTLKELCCSEASPGWLPKELLRTALSGQKSLSSLFPQQPHVTRAVFRLGRLPQIRTAHPWVPPAMPRCAPSP